MFNMLSLLYSYIKSYNMYRINKYLIKKKIKGNTFPGIKYHI
jgi:hypothetical protein